MVGGVSSQRLGAPGNPSAKNPQNDARNSENHEDEKNGLRFIEINKLTHPSDHRCEELTDQRKQRCENRSASTLKSSSFHKNIYGTCHGRSRRTNIEFQPTRPLRGATPVTKFNVRQTNFNPRAPCGARLPSFITSIPKTTEFQPTRPLRGATRWIPGRS